MSEIERLTELHGADDRSVLYLRIEKLRADKKAILTEYSEWLGKYGYLDSDWWVESPNAVDRFMEEK